MPFTQTNRRFTVATPLASEALVLRRMSGSEQISRLFEFDLELHSDDFDIKHEEMLGENVTVGIELPDGKLRHINGFVSRISMDGYNGHHVVYRATLSPWFWFLTRTSDCRIFQEMTVPEIIKKVFKDHGFSDFEDRLTGTYRKWEYCVQYRETDFNFLSRLMEQEGIYYFFTHKDGKHDLVMSDAPSAHQTTEGYEEIPYYPPDEMGRRERDHLQNWTASKQIQPGSYSLTDYDFKAPKKSLAASSEVPRDHTASEFEIFDYPGEYAEAADGEHYVKARIQELQAQHEILQGDGDAAGLCTGSTFELTLFPRKDQNRKYLIIGASYDLTSSPLEGGSDDEDENFHIQIQAIDAEQAFRAARTTPKPAVQGVQTAVVVGPKGEEIHTDEYGRVKVQFHWDRYGEANENSSCWIRVAHVWAGKNWGGIYTPRIGQEVIVDFLEGDPDQPIITGRVYNKDNMPPYDLPANKTISGIKSNSSKGGEGFNELRFEDKKGEEQVFIHAEKNMDIRVKNDRFENIDKDRHLTVKNDKFELIENNRNEEVTNDHIEKIGKDRNLEVAGKEAKKVTQTLSLTVDGDVAEVFKANHSMQVTDDSYIKGTNICIEATDNITLKVGGSSISIESGGITIETSGDVKIKAGGNLDAEGGANTTIKAGANLEAKAGANAKIEGGAMMDVKGGAMTNIKGAMVNIN
ncbi:MAG: type VI secretion system secreted protein VgrG [Oleiphilaceae bacterium]|jgi:type VI secretion system secreted protein VgrG